jgi:hypothetical protein
VIPRDRGTDWGVGGRYEWASAGDVTMWGIRAIRAGVLLGGMLTTLAATGCCECCPCLKLWKSEKPPAPATADDTKQVQKEWKTWWFEDQPAHPTPERIHGGIY